MNRPRMIRRLRIVWTAFFGVLCVLLVALWVRSYSEFYFVRWNLLSIATVTNWSVNGRIHTLYWSGATPGSWVVGNVEDNLGLLTSLNLPSFTFYHLANGGEFAIPHGVVVLAFVASAVTPWLPWKFSLRTLLIVTTLTAVVLGLMVWSIS